MDNKNNKLDQWAKESLEEREISPSPSVWDQLEKALDEEQIKSPKPKRPNLFILGAFIAALFGVLGFWMIEGKPTQTEEIKYQTQEVKNLSTSNPINEHVAPITTPVSTEDKDENEQVQQVIHSSSEPKINVAGKPFEKVQFLPKQKVPSTMDTENKIPVEEKKGGEKPTEKIFAQDNRTSQPVNVVVEEPQKDIAVAANDKTSHDAKVDAKSLLAEVQKDLATNRSKYLVDPKELLRVAEQENNETFLRKMLKTVSETSTSVIAMVNNRNVEP